MADVEPRPEEDDEKIPYSAIRNQLIILGLFPLSESIAWTSVFPYVYSMIKSFSVSSDEGDKTAAVWAGILVSVFTFGEFLMAPIWARISDNIGRKPTLLIGSLAAMLSALFFGFSTSLPMAVVARSFAGLVNPNLGVVQTFVGERTLGSKEHQAKGFSLIPFLRNLGRITGPLIGGYLAEPVKNFPFLFSKNSVWEKFPYLLPNLVVVFCLFISCVICFLFLEEVHPSFVHRRDRGLELSERLKNAFRKRARADRREYTSLAGAEPGTELSEEDGTDTPPKMPEKSRPLPRVNRRDAFTKQVLLQIFSFTILGFISIGALALIPIFLATPTSTDGARSSPSTSQTGTGGFGLSNQHISNVLLTQAIASLLNQILLVPQLISKLGLLTSYRLAQITATVIYVLLPFTAQIHPSGLGLGAMLLLYWILAASSGMYATSTSILLTNSTPSPVYLATVNGVAVSASCLARTAGPALCGWLLRRGAEAHFIALPFVVLAAVAAASVALSFTFRVPE